jgi:hypothetical protein
LEHCIEIKSVWSFKKMWLVDIVQLSPNP